MTAATVDTGSLSDSVITDGTPWQAVLEWRVPGAVGNAGSFSIGFNDGDPFSIEVLDHYSWDAFLGEWVSTPNNVGVKVISDTLSMPTVADIEAAIDASSDLARVLTPDVDPTKLIDPSIMEGITSGAPFFGGEGVWMAAAYARMLIALLPPGKLWDLIASVLRKLLEACAEELARVDQRAGQLLAESHPLTATELLPEYEDELDLDEASTTGERRARIAGRTVARQRYRPTDFQIALAPLLGQAAADVVVIEISSADALATGDVRAIFTFLVYRNPAAPGTYYVASAQELVDQIKPSHTIGHVIESVDFICDDPFSICDRDLLGG